MTASLTGFRAAIVAVLAPALGIEFVNGRIEGPQQVAYGCSWPNGKRQNSQDANLEDLHVFARVFVPYGQQHEETRPPDPVALEDIVDLIQTSLDNIQSAAGPWQFLVTVLDTDLDGWCVTATIVGTQFNMFAQT